MQMGAGLQPRAVEDLTSRYSSARMAQQYLQLYERIT